MDECWTFPGLGGWGRGGAKRGRLSRFPVIILFLRSPLVGGEESISKEINFYKITSHDSSSVYAFRVLKSPFLIQFYYLDLFSKLYFKTLAIKANNV